MDSADNAYGSKSSAEALTQNWTQDENTMVRIVYVLTPLDPSGETRRVFLMKAASDDGRLLKKVAPSHRQPLTSKPCSPDWTRDVWLLIFAFVLLLFALPRFALPTCPPPNPAPAYQTCPVPLSHRPRPSSTQFLSPSYRQPLPHFSFATHHVHPGQSHSSNLASVHRSPHFRPSSMTTRAHRNPHPVPRFSQVRWQRWMGCGLGDGAGKV